MLKRYIGPEPEIMVSIHGQDYGLVRQGESIPVPDEIAEITSWAETNWEDGTPSNPSNTPSDDDANKEVN
jgi:hypothetical protein